MSNRPGQTILYVDTYNVHAIFIVRTILRWGLSFGKICRLLGLRCNIWMESLVTVRWSIQNIPDWCCKNHKNKNKRVWKLPTSTQQRATWHTDSLDMVVLPYTGASRYHNCCVVVGTSPEYFGYTIMSSSYLYRSLQSFIVCPTVYAKWGW
jgi:hypothetical protein